MENIKQNWKKKAHCQLFKTISLEREMSNNQKLILLFDEIERKQARKRLGKSIKDKSSLNSNKNGDPK